MSFSELFEQIKWIPSFDIGIIDIAQIIVLSFAIYYLAKSLHKTRAWILVKGLVIIGVIYLIICLTEMTVLRIIIQSLFSSLLIAIVIMLQPELQKLVELIGKKRLTDFKSLLIKKQDVPTWYTDKDIYEIISACEDMGKAKTGALIVLERGIPLSDYIESGIPIGASISSQLLINIFEKNTPLHDGAVIIKNNKISAATCYLPLSTNTDIDKSLGTRHRAAIGVSENTDCVVVVVSEETGEISVCFDGKILHSVNRAQFTETLREQMYKTDEKITTSVRKKSKTPIWIKVIAPIISIVLWLSVMSSTDPIVTTTIRDVQVQTINTTVLDELGQTYFIKSGNSIDVKVKGRRSLLDNMLPEHITAIADFSDMSSVFAIPIMVEPNGLYSDVEILDNNHIMKLKLEDLVQTEIPVEIEIFGNTNDNYVVSLQSCDTTSLVITCTQSLAETLDKAIVRVDSYNKEKDFISTVSPMVYDKNGSEISQDSITLNIEQIRVSVNVFEVKEIPLEIDLSEQNKNGEFYYELNSATPETDTVRLAGPNDIVASLDKLTINITPDAKSELISTMLVNIKQYLPDGVCLANNQNEQISVELNLTKYQKVTIPLTRTDVKIINEGKSSIAISDTPKEIILYYNTSKVDVELLTLEMLNPTIKVKESSSRQAETNIVLTDIEDTYVVGSLVVKYVATR